MSIWVQQDKPTTYSDTSKARLATCDQRIQGLFNILANEGWDISILCGHRDQAAQNEAHTTGKSKATYPDSDHNTCPSMAIDAAPWVPGGVGIPWNDGDAVWCTFAGVVLTKAKELDIPLEWGGFYINPRKDMNHFSLVLPR